MLENDVNIDVQNSRAVNVSGGILFAFKGKERKMTKECNDR